VSALGELEAEFPGWYCWRGIGGILYARRLLSSPPAVVRAATVDGLRGQIREKLAAASHQ
jgi:hypothetical protein